LSDFFSCDSFSPNEVVFDYVPIGELTLCDASLKYKYYYTKAEGLIGFEDLEGTLWKQT